MSLNFPYLRWKSKVKEFSKEEIARFSRRTFMQSSAALAFGQDVPLPMFSSRISFHHEADSAAFQLDGQERWVFTPETLAGGAQLIIHTHTLQEIRLSIIGGRYPGTAIPFDIELEARWGILGWSYSICLPRQRLKAQGNLIDWLTGAPAVWRHAQALLYLSSASPIAVRTSAESLLTFDCRWNLTCNGRTQIWLPGNPQSLTADGIQLSLPGVLGDVEPLAMHSGPFSRLTIKRNSNPWGAELVALLRAPVIRVGATVEMFDQMHIDAWESQGAYSRVAASFSQSIDKLIPVTLHGRAQGSDGGPVVLPLVRPTYSLATVGSAVESVFFAAIQKPVQACSSDQVTVLDGQIEITQKIAESGGLSAFLGASKITLKHFEQPDGTQVDFLLPTGYKLPVLHLDHKVDWLERGFDAVEQLFVSIFAADRFVCPLDGVILRILRPSDMLYLHFSFSGLRLKMRAGKPFLEQQRVGKGKSKVAKSTITVHFQPQNRQEDSFYEDAGGNVPPTAGEEVLVIPVLVGLRMQMVTIRRPPGQLAYASPAPKVKISSSGPSRLKFIVPTSAFESGLPFNVETLLGWDRFIFLPGKNSNGKDGTRIEVPYRLYLTPRSKATFLHDVTPRTLVNAIPDITAARTEFPALWGTLLQDGNRRAHQGFDATPISMTAFGAADVVEIVQLQVVDSNKIHAYYAEPLKFAVGSATIYAAGKNSGIYTGSSHIVQISEILDPDSKFPGMQGVEYTFSGPSLSIGLPITLDFSLWLVQTPPNSAQIGGVKLPPMLATDRAQILVWTSGEPKKAINVNRLAMTSLGAWFDADAKWDTIAFPSLNLNLAAWRHITVLGRDEYVQVEHEGYLWPFGHGAALITRTQRVFYSVFPVDTCADDKIFCYLRQQNFIHVKERVKTYPDARQKTLGRDLPFTSVEIETDTTPPLDPPETSYFFPKVTTGPASNQKTDKFKFDLVGYDWAVPTTPIPFKAPLMFVPYGDNLAMAAELAAIEAMYHKDGDDCVDFGGQHIHFAASTKSGDTDLKAQSITFCGILMDTLCTTTCVAANFYPSLLSATADIPAVQVLGGAEDHYSTVSFHNHYVQNGFDTSKDAAEIFLAVGNETSGQGAGKPRALGFPSQHSGGIAVPTMPIVNVSRAKGATSVDVGTKFDIQSFFKTILDSNFPKLFGVIPLLDIIAPNGNLGIDDIPEVIPNLVNGAAVAYQHFNEIAQGAKAVIETTQALLRESRAQATKQCVRLLLAPSVQNELTTLVPDTLKSALQDVQTAIVKARSDLDRKATALDLNNLDQLSAAAEISFQNTASNLVQQLGPAIVQSINSLSLDLFQLEELFEELDKIVGDINSAETGALTQLKSIESELQAFSKDKVVQCITDQCSDLQGQVKLLLTSILQAEMTLLVGRMSTEIVQAVEAPVIALQTQLDNALDQSSTTQQEAFAAAIQATAGLSADAINTLNDAEVSYTTAIEAVRTMVNDAVTEAENTIAQQIASAINDHAVGAIVSAAVSGLTIADQVADNLQRTFQFIQQVMQLVDALEGLLGAPIEYGVDYKLPPIALQSIGIFQASEDPDITTALQIEAKINVTNPSVTNLKFDPKFDYQADVTINNFGILLLERDPAFLTILFDSVKFTTSSHDHPQFVCKLNTVIFGPPLDFVQGLVDAFNPMKTGQSGPLIALTADGLSIGYGFAFDDIEGGGFQITGLFLGVQVSLSFNGDPLRIRFYFARPEKHFLISAGIYGGGGFLILEGGPSGNVKPNDSGGNFAHSPGGIDAFQVCLEFGATVDLDLDIASGEAHVLGGYYLALNNGYCALTGFVRCGGSMSILDIATMSIEWYVGLTYAKGGSVNGRASVTVNISIGFFSVSATVSINWTWAGSPQKNQSSPISPTSGLNQNLGHGGIERVVGRRPNFSAPRMIADYDPVEVQDQSVSPACPITDSSASRMQYMSKDIWNRYASAFARVPNH
jgi:hypothetical protein